MLTRMMTKMIAMAISVTGGMGCTLLNSAEMDAQVEQQFKYKLSVCALFKDEAKYLREWIEYHRLIGVEHFYLFDNGSGDYSKYVLAPYIRDGIVTLTHWPDRVPVSDTSRISHWALSTQLPAYELTAKHLALEETEWLALLDVDEYLVPVEANSMGEVLKEFADYPGLQLTSDFFDASHIDALPRRDLLIATIELTTEPKKRIETSLEKIIFKPKEHTTFYWPPYRCNYKNDKQPALMSRKEVRINKYVNRSYQDNMFNKRKDKLNVDSRQFSERERRELLDIGYELDDAERAINRFEPLLRKKLGFR